MVDVVDFVPPHSLTHLGPRDPRVSSLASNLKFGQLLGPLGGPLGGPLVGPKCLRSWNGLWI